MLTAIVIIFIVGYLSIVFEHKIKVNKAASALVTGVVCWTVYIMSGADVPIVEHQLTGHLGEVAGIIFFLLGAMTIVQLIDAHDGFQIVIDRIQTTNKRKLVWIIAIITFFLSAVLDNLTTAIVMVSLLRKIVSEKHDRWMLTGLVVMAANAGGAWSPIGDVTTTMLWMGKQVTAENLILKTFLPSVASIMIPAFLIASRMKGAFERPQKIERNLNYTTSRRERNAVFWVGIGCLLFVPVFKTITHLPPYMGILFALGLMWIITEQLHGDKDEEEKGFLSVNHALRKIDTPSVLFFLGILLSIGALQATGFLENVAGWMDKAIGNTYMITLLIGLLSAVVDNVPLVAAAQGMYPLEQFPTDHYFWEFLAYCAGTGGSILIIGSAAGIAAMGIEKMDFVWYLKKIAWLALLGYLAGAAVFLLQQQLF
jgi:Na+/H+ antiporter NhaD/arsenite permease-like protein